MNTSNTLIASAVAAAISLAAGFAVAQQVPAETPKFQAEKCFAVAKAGKNDCQTAASSCAGTSKKDNQADAWIYVPAGTCAKIAGGMAKS